MNCVFSLSKDNLSICSFNNKLLHSSYNPKKEAERFVNSIKVDFEPTFLVFTGPCLPYSVPFLKSRFPNTKIIAIQYTDDFVSYNDSFFLTINFTTLLTENSLAEKIFNIIGEENILSTLFISWPPSESAFKKEYVITWSAIKKTIKKCTAILTTRQYFNKRWLRNSINFFTNVQDFYTIKKTDFPVLIIASGASLKNSLPFIKQNQQNAIIVALSSSVKVLLSNSIIPDFVMTTDGGFWAKEHLKSVSNSINHIPIIAPFEANVPHKVLQNNPIIPLDYNDDLGHFICSNIIDSKKNKVFYGTRNGTVAGTAIELWLNLTSKKIYFIGLDLDSSKGFSHTQPNELELNNYADFKLSSTETRIIPQTFKNESLLIYRNWFETRNVDFYKRVFRLVTDKDNLKPIEHLTDVNINFVELKTKNEKINLTKKTISFFESKKKIKELLINETKKISKSKYNDFSDINDFWFKSCALIEYIKFLNLKDSNKKEAYLCIVSKTLETINSLLKLVD